LLRFAVCTAALSFGVAAGANSPCDGIEQQTSVERQMSLQTSVAKQLDVSAVGLRARFELSGWSVLYVDTHQSDEVFLFYSADPLSTPFLSMWSGAAMRAEAPALQA
jgi:hypothetical protein